MKPHLTPKPSIECMFCGSMSTTMLFSDWKATKFLICNNAVYYCNDCGLRTSDQIVAWSTNEDGNVEIDGNWVLSHE